jgi:hydrogenase large subunit
MVFKNLPIELDNSGQARLRVGGLADPFGVVDTGGRRTNGEAGSEKAAKARESLSQEAAINAHARFFEVDPLTRSANRLSFRAIIDFDNRRVLDARVEKTGFQCLEMVLHGRAPTDAVHIASRESGAGAGANAIAAAMALEMALEIAPPPLAIITRGLGAAAELLAAHTRHLFVMTGPDFSESIVSRTNMTIWAKAQQAPARGAAFHGYRTIAELMREMNPISGYLYREALHLSRVACEVATLVFGKYPHPSSLFPGGVGIVADKEIFNQILGRINRLIDYAKKVTAVWDDLIEFFYAADPQFLRLGEAPANLICAGMWDDPATYDARFENCSAWGEKRLVTPGVMVNGKLRTTRLSELNTGIEEFSDRAFFEQQTDGRSFTDPLGTPLSPLHPWNRLKIPAPERGHWNGRYSWGAAPRWDREPVETGPIARQWITAVAGKLKNEFIHAFKNSSEGAGLEIDLPRFQLPALRLRWRLPDKPNALERNRARAYHIGYCGMTALTYLLKAFDCLQRGEKAMSTRYCVPQEAIGAGFWEDGQGTLTHHVVIVEGRIANYQIVTPSAWMGSPQDPFGRPGPYEQAIINTPLLEEFAKPEDFTGIDLLRAIRSFDP